MWQLTCSLQQWRASSSAGRTHTGDRRDIFTGPCRPLLIPTHKGQSPCVLSDLSLKLEAAFLIAPNPHAFVQHPGWMFGDLGLVSLTKSHLIARKKQAGRILY